MQLTARPLAARPTDMQSELIPKEVNHHGSLRTTFDVLHKNIFQSHRVLSKPLINKPVEILYVVDVRLQAPGASVMNCFFSRILILIPSLPEFFFGDTFHGLFTQFGNAVVYNVKITLLYYRRLYKKSINELLDKTYY